MKKEAWTMALSVLPQTLLQQNFTFTPTYSPSPPSFGFDPSFIVVPLIFFIFVVVVIIAAARGFGSRGTIQRPLTQDTAFAPPPPPDTVLVKCQYCGTQQTWRETCIQCGAPLPKPHVP